MKQCAKIAAFFVEYHLNISAYVLMGALKTLVYISLRFAATWGQNQKYVEQSELWAALSCVGAVVGPLTLLFFTLWGMTAMQMDTSMPPETELKGQFQHRCVTDV